MGLGGVHDFVIDDIVKYGANAGVCTTNHTSASFENSFYSTDLAYWDLHTEGLRNRGDYQTTSVWYALNDLVKYGNTVYRCTTAHVGPASFDLSGQYILRSELKTFGPRNRLLR